MPTNGKDVRDYLPDMDQISEEIPDKIEASYREQRERTVTPADVRAVLQKDRLTPDDYYVLLSDVAEEFLDEMAVKARMLRRQYFGDNVNSFSPLYIANYCENGCRYCGFNSKSGIKRAMLTEEEIENEMKALAAEGIEDVLILTGESDKFSPIEYIEMAVRLARKYFRVVSLEIYPANVKDYERLQKAGADFVTVFQETYDPESYSYYHPHGHKRSMIYRMNTQERAAMGGMRGVGFGALFGLSDPLRDAYSMGLHAFLLQRKYPHLEIAISLPRIRPTHGAEDVDNTNRIDEKKLMQFILAIRIFMPFASMTISTRERKEFRDKAMYYGATKISASVDTGIGRRTEEHEEDEGEEQFVIADNRTLDEIEKDLAEEGLYVLRNDYIRL
ncbi:thiazole biosynthesis protein ThiH [Aedoeadaptatus nemausensis]|uniref:Thiazole biosynthesis protein ThiH n=1 Tax=Aedoeadaptatus nemausensis TaxID=2582829 RepID=A0A6V6Y4M7_9FIRM|nr:2-iminoacetate synthase ThiH [Peptoniphilus nemausensis]CAC9931938.1 thiazole biosynthesis protein ThiH [Peptoniphilus nemausensis]